jgi:5-methylcytosine-specific restriction endonuclease McrA
MRQNPQVPLSPPERDLDVLARACDALSMGDVAAADAAAAELRAELPSRSSRKPITPVVQVQVLRRDRYICRYCGTRTVPSPILRSAALAWPEFVPYNPNWRSDSTHPIFVARAATFDHVNPHAHGGTDVTEANLVTACWSCNLQKSEFSLERLGWTLREVDASGNWDGLTHAYPALWERAKASASEADVRFHTRWLRLLCG